MDTTLEEKKNPFEKLDKAIGNLFTEKEAAKVVEEAQLVASMPKKLKGNKLLIMPTMVKACEVKTRTFSLCGCHYKYCGIGPFIKPESKSKGQLAHASKYIKYVHGNKFTWTAK